MVIWHHWLNGHEFEWTLGVGDGQGGLACCSPWGLKELDTTATELNWTEQRGWLKKDAQTWELWVKFYLGQNEDSSLGNSISDSSEKILQRGRGGSQYIGDFGEGGIQAIILFCRFLRSWVAVIAMKYFSAFLDIRRYKNLAHKIVFWKYLAI